MLNLMKSSKLYRKMTEQGAMTTGLFVQVLAWLFNLRNKGDHFLQA